MYEENLAEISHREMGYRDGCVKGYQDGLKDAKFDDSIDRDYEMSAMYVAGYKTGYYEGYNNGKQEHYYGKMMKRNKRLWNLKQVVWAIIIAILVFVGIIGYNYLETNDTTISEVLDTYVFKG